jgi:hypothetical protein
MAPLSCPVLSCPCIVLSWAWHTLRSPLVFDFLMGHAQQQQPAALAGKILVHLAPNMQPFYGSVEAMGGGTASQVADFHSHAEYSVHDCTLQCPEIPQRAEEQHDKAFQLYCVVVVVVVWHFSCSLCDSICLTDRGKYCYHSKC